MRSLSLSCGWSHCIPELYVEHFPNDLTSGWGLKNWETWRSSISLAIQAIIQSEDHAPLSLSCLWGTHTIISTLVHGVPYSLSTLMFMGTLPLACFMTLCPNVLPCLYLEHFTVFPRPLRPLPQSTSFLLPACQIH